MHQHQDNNKDFHLSKRFIDLALEYDKILNSLPAVRSPNDYIDLSHGNPYQPPNTLDRLNLLTGQEFQEPHNKEHNNRLHQYQKPFQMNNLLYQQIINYYRKDGLTLKKNASDTINDITIGLGTTQLFMAAIYVLLDEDQKILTPKPYYTAFEQIATQFKNPFKFIETSENQNYKPSIEQIEKALKEDENVRCLFFSNPTNPTGAVYTEHEIVAIANLLKKKQYRSVWLIVDEVYDKVILKSKINFISMGAISGIDDRTITLKGLSKTHGLARERIGFALGPEKIIAAMSEYTFKTIIGVPESSQRIAALALKYTDESFYESINNYYRKSLFLVKQEIEKINRFFNAYYHKKKEIFVKLVTEPDAGFFVCLSFNYFLNWALPNGDRLTTDVKLAYYLAYFCQCITIPS